MTRCNLLPPVLLPRILIQTLFAVCISLSCLLLLSCQKSNSSNATSAPPPTVDKRTEIEKHSDADYLFDHYFGEYNLPVEMKQSMETEFQMVANGVAMLHAQGKDEKVLAAIEFLEKGLAELKRSGQLAQMMAEAKERFRLFQEMQAASRAAGLPDDPPPMTELEHLEAALLRDDLDAEAKNNIAESAKREREKLAEGAELVKRYNLPYPLEGHSGKYLTYIPFLGATTFAQNDSGKGSKDQDSSQKEGKQKGNLAEVDTWDWWTADVAWADTGYNPTNHVGIVKRDRENGVNYIVDAMPGAGVQETKDLKTWAERGGWKEVRRYSFRPPTGAWTAYCEVYDGPGYTCLQWGQFWKEYGDWTDKSYKRNYAYNYALRTVGTPYSLLSGLFTPGTPSSAYCSQLVWKAYWEGSSTNLVPSAALFVTPGEIIRARYMQLQNTGAKQMLVEPEEPEPENPIYNPTYDSRYFWTAYEPLKDSTGIWNFYSQSFLDKYGDTTNQPSPLRWLAVHKTAASFSLVGKAVRITATPVPTRGRHVIDPNPFTPTVDALPPQSIEAIARDHGDDYFYFYPTTSEYAAAFSYPTNPPGPGAGWMWLQTSVADPVARVGSPMVISSANANNAKITIQAIEPPPQR